MATRMAGALARWATRRRPDGCPPGGRSSWGGWLPTPRVVGMQLAVGAGAGAGMSRGLSTSACAGAGMSAGFVRLHIRGGGLRGHGGRGGRPGGRRAEAVLARGVHWTTAPRSSSSPPASSNPWSRLHPIANPHGFGKPGKFDSGGKAALMKGKGPRGHSPEELPQLSNYEQPLIVPPSPQELAQNAGPMQIVIQRCEGIRWRVFGNVPDHVGSRGRQRLKAKLKGDSVMSWYPKTMAEHKPILYREQGRFWKVRKKRRREARGKFRTRKGQGKAASLKKKR